MKILYFAWLRERLNRAEEIIAPPANLKTVADLMDFLAQRDDAFAHATANRQLIRAAIDEQIVEHDAPIANASTVAFFPPMTGG